MTGDSDLTVVALLSSLIGGTEATGHEAEAKSRRRRNSAKSVLLLPDLEHAKAAVLISRICSNSPPEA